MPLSVASMVASRQMTNLRSEAALNVVTAAGTDPDTQSVISYQLSMALSFCAFPH